MDINDGDKEDDDEEHAPGNDGYEHARLHMNARVIQKLGRNDKQERD